MKTPTASGVITNYNCTASCRHCMFASSVHCKKDYMTRERAEEIAGLLEMAGTTSVHIGGGEPFMDFDGLCHTVNALHRHGIGIDYIETNGYWAKNEQEARRKLEVLRRIGVYSVMVSVDPFHIEYVPLELPLRLAGLLEEYGFGYFIWQEKFLRRLMKLDITKTHTQQELKDVLGEDYVTQTAKEYGLGINGRALAFADKLYGKKDASVIATAESCPALTRPHHCHIDLYGKAIPSRCTGICLDAKDYLTGDIKCEKYPVVYHLIHGGTAELLEYARQKGFVAAEDGYATKCSLCFDIRRYLLAECPSQDLGPDDYYRQMETQNV